MVPEMNAAVRRRIARTSPLTEGGDVKILQQALNRLLKHWKLPHRLLKVDGEAGPKTFKAALIMAFAVGLGRGHISKVKRGVIPKETQRLLRAVGTDEDLRSKRQKRAARRRRKRVAKLRHTKQARIAKTLKAAGSFVGQTESPAGSNRGPGIISKCQINILGFDGNPWCGCFTGDLTRRFGGVKGITSRVAYTPYTAEDAEAGRNGFVVAVDPVHAKPGDHALFNFGAGGIKHTGFVLRHESGGVITREGNTSGGPSGSQDNGGGVYDRFRSYSEIVVCARPNWK